MLGSILVGSVIGCSNCRMLDPYVATTLWIESTAPVSFDVHSVCDNRVMASISAAFDPKHPLLADRKRLDEIADVMYAKIHKTLFAQHPGPRRSARSERILIGTAVSADDVLAPSSRGSSPVPAKPAQQYMGGLGGPDRPEQGRERIESFPERPSRH